VKVRTAKISSKELRRLFKPPEFGKMNVVRCIRNGFESVVGRVVVYSKAPSVHPRNDGELSPALGIREMAYTFVFNGTRIFERSERRSRFRILWENLTNAFLIYPVTRRRILATPIVASYLSYPILKILNGERPSPQ